MSSSSTSATIPTKYVGAVLARNYDALNSIRTFIGLLTGLLAGVLGLTGYVGFLFFIATYYFASFVFIQGRACVGPATYYFPNGQKDFFSPGGLLGALPSFILMWTLAYDSIYLF